MLTDIAIIATIGQLFFASSGTWTVSQSDVQRWQYEVIGSHMVMTLVLENTSTSSGMGEMLFIDLPAGVPTPIDQNQIGFGHFQASGTRGMCWIQADAGHPRLVIRRADGVAWPSNKNDLHLRLQFIGAI